ncbi:MAG TPA: hypothetical protein VH062_04465 [Polyangiaceae bacterium]|jgi:hypothetical protein|nr:hypothetical protein [Polyangiaceae bacterium]
MKRLTSAAAVALLAVAGCKSESVKPAADASTMPPATSSDGSTTGTVSDKTSFFVSSDTSKTANLGGLAGADARCGRLAAAANLPKHTWHAYLSVEHADGGPLNARDRIGAGPWYNVRGVKLADDLASLHARTGDADVFLSESGGKIPGQWAGSPEPVAHDVLTGSGGDGTLLKGETCGDWTSESSTETAQVGHTDGLGPNMNSNPPYTSWNSAHANGGCNDTAPLGGAGRIYCFAVD